MRFGTLHQPAGKGLVGVRRLRGGVVARLFESGRIEIEGEALSPDVQESLLVWLDRSLK